MALQPLYDPDFPLHTKNPFSTPAVPAHILSGFTADSDPSASHPPGTKPV